MQEGWSHGTSEGVPGRAFGSVQARHSMSGQPPSSKAVTAATGEFTKAAQAYILRRNRDRPDPRIIELETAARSLE